jgi:hypothetical protein
MINTEVISMLKMNIYLSLMPTPPLAAPQILIWMGVSHGWALLAHQVLREVLMGNTGNA